MNDFSNYEYYYVGTTYDEFKENNDYDCAEYSTCIWSCFKEIRDKYKEAVNTLNAKYPGLAKYQDDIGHGGLRWSCNIQINKTIGVCDSTSL